MREIIQIQVGGCGNQIGTRFIESIASEHEINPNGAWKGNPDTLGTYHQIYFEELSNNKYVSRTIVADLDPESATTIKNSPYNKLFSPENIVVGKYSAGNMWCKGHYEYAPDIIDKILDVSRKQVEKCDCLQGFQFTHSLGGGTGSGLGSLIMMNLKDEYPERLISTFTSCSDYYTDCLVFPYNTVLSIPQLIDQCEVVHVIESESLYNTCFKKLGLKTPYYKDLNYIITNIMSSVTSTMRFPDQHLSSLRKYCSGICTEIWAHFLSVGSSPAWGLTNSKSLIQTISDNTNQSCGISLDKGKYLGPLLGIFRGNLNPIDAMDSIEGDKDQLPDTIKNVITNYVPKSFENMETSLTTVSNSTSIKQMFKKLQDQFKALFKTKKFVYAFASNGLEEFQMVEAESYLNDLIEYYNDLEGATEEIYEKED